MDELCRFDCLGGFEDVLKRPHILCSFGFPRQVYQDVSSLGEGGELIVRAGRRQVKGVRLDLWRGGRHRDQVHSQDPLHRWTRRQAGRNPSA
jgi:hypothetical protein